MGKAKFLELQKYHMVDSRDIALRQLITDSALIRLCKPRVNGNANKIASSKNEGLKLCAKTTIYNAYG